MKIFGLEITRAKAAPPTTYAVAPRGTGGWYPIVRDWFPGAWQRNLERSTESILNYSAVFRCISLISSDIAKMRIRLVEQDANGIWTEVPERGPQGAAFWPVLRKPNRFQSRIQFYESWMESKLINGNTYVLKERDERNVVTRLYVLDPRRVQVLVAPDGSVFYELDTDYLGGLSDVKITAPASEIIHDRWNTFYHPLIGISPIVAAGLSAMQGLRIQENSNAFFAGGANPGGILTAPGHVNDDTAARLKQYWDEKYGAGGSAVGTVAVLGDGLKYEPMTMTAVDSQMLEQLKWTAENVASVFGVPPYMIGVSAPPTYNNIEALQLQYYTQGLQIHIESIEVLLDEGLGLGPQFGNQYGTEFDLETLLRLDSATLIKVTSDGVRAAIFAPNEARARFGLKPKEGGDSPMIQQQNWSLEALSRRDAVQSPDSTPSEVMPDGNAAEPPDDEEAADAEPTDEERQIARSEAREFLTGWLERHVSSADRRAA